MKRCVAIFLVILSALLLGLSTQSGALHAEFSQPNSPVLLPDAGDVADFGDVASETAAPAKDAGAKDAGARGAGGEVAAMRQFLKEVCEVNHLPLAENHSYRDLPLELRERLFWALFRAEQSLSLPTLETPRRRADLRPNCKHPNLLNLLTGKKRQTPLTLIDMPTGMGGGPELDFLELRMLELQGVADIMVVAESSYTFRGDRKPRHYQLNAERFQAFNDTVLYMDLEQCDKYWLGINDVREKHGQRRAFWAIENRQRGCLWTMLERDRPNLTDDAIVIFTDLDEIPNGELMMAMKHCEWKAWNPKMQFRQRVVTFNLRQVLSNRPGCFPKDAWRQGALFRLGWARDTIEKNQSIPLRMKGYPGSRVREEFVSLPSGELTVCY
eukprot:s312_g6.t1